MDTTRTSGSARGNDPAGVVLVGASPFGSRALDRLRIPYMLVVDPHEDPTDVEGRPRSVVRSPYRSDPTAVLDLPRPPDVRAVVSFTELGLLPASVLGAAWGVQAVPAEAVVATRNKILMRSALAATKQSIRFGRLVNGGRELDPRLFPIVVKPVDGVAGVGVRMLRSAAELWALDATDDRPMIWEQYVEGREFSVETVTRDGRHRVLGVTEKITTGPPHFVEHGHLTPAAVDGRTRRMLTGETMRCLDAVGLTVGPAHTELIVSDDDVTVVETHTRPGGGRIPRITELVSGLDQYELAMRALLGWDLPAGRRRHRAAGVRFLARPAGIVDKVTGADFARSLPGIDEVTVDVTAGDSVREWRDNLDRVGFVVGVGGSHEEVAGRLRTADGRIVVNVRERRALTAAGVGSSAATRSSGHDGRSRPDPPCPAPPDSAKAGDV
jgi:predicted ATP-grasp superfamily ATP-dependent carboligase